MISILRNFIGNKNFYIIPIIYFFNYMKNSYRILKILIIIFLILHLYFFRACKIYQYFKYLSFSNINKKRLKFWYLPAKRKVKKVRMMQKIKKHVKAHQGKLPYIKYAVGWEGLQNPQ